MTENEILLRVQCVAIKRGSRPLFSQLSFDVKRNQLVILEGENGCGKTSLLECIVRERHTNAGVIECNAVRVSFVVQERVAFWNLTVEENLCLALPNTSNWSGLLTRSPWRYGYDKGILETTGLDGNQKASFLSGGQVQILKLIQISARDGDLVLLDEPFNDLDESAVALSCRLIKKMLSRAAIILVSHFVPKELEADHIVNLDDYVGKHSAVSR